MQNAYVCLILYRISTQQQQKSNIFFFSKGGGSFGGLSNFLTPSSSSSSSNFVDTRFHPPPSHHGGQHHSQQHFQPPPPHHHDGHQFHHDPHQFHHDPHQFHHDPHQVHHGGGEGGRPQQSFVDQLSGFLFGRRKRRRRQGRRRVISKRQASNIQNNIIRLFQTTGMDTLNVFPYVRAALVGHSTRSGGGGGGGVFTRRGVSFKHFHGMIKQLLTFSFFKKKTPEFLRQPVSRLPVQTGRPPQLPQQPQRRILQ